VALSPEDRALIERLSTSVETAGRDTARALERVDQTIRRFDDHVAEDQRRFEEVAKAMAGKAGKEVEQKVDKVSSRQNWFMGLGAGAVFILTFFKASIVNLFSGGSPPPTP
jgi:hypothetical protein